MALPLLAKAWTMWFCMRHSMQKLPWRPAGGAGRGEGHAPRRPRSPEATLPGGRVPARDPEGG